MPETILVTGATAGFGREIARKLIADGHRVIGTGRRMERLNELASELGDAFLPFQLDMTDRDALRALPGSLPEGWGTVDVLINNAGLAQGIERAQDADIDGWERMIATNVSGLVEITRALLPGMVERNHGYVLSIGSTAGAYAYQGGNVYGGTKAFVDQFMRNLRTDVLGKHIRITNVAPGLCGGTEFSNVRMNDDAKAAKVYENTQPLTAQDIAHTVSWLVALPPHVNVNIVELMPTCQAPGGLAVDRTMG